MNIGEQDMPMITDKFDIWLRVKIADSYFNNSKRKIKEIKIQPLKK